MRLLLDTHAFLWFILNDPHLSTTARILISDPANDVEVSPASYWEIAIKLSTKKYSLSQPYRPFLEGQIRSNRFRILPIEIRHTEVLIGLPFHHRDPFDRLVIAQALAEGVPVVSADAAFDNYGVTRLW
jgi:PIN domain nuclease of toxin-antitoxin system